MADDLIRYDVLVQDALRGVVRTVMREVAETGLPGDHHFYISFDTTAAGVRMSSRLRQQHPEEMTIVLQHQFWDLSVSDHGFDVGLSFGGVPERLLVPFAAVKGFFDPSVQFGLQFDPTAATPGQTMGESPVPQLPARPVDETPDGAADTEATAENAGDDEAAEAPAERETADVVSLDAFRKNK